MGSISTKGVVLDESGEILADTYLWTEGDPVGAVKRLMAELAREITPDVSIQAVGTTGSARRLVGAMLEASCVKNEITAHAVGTLSCHPDTRTILEIGGQDSKIILLQDGIVVDYAMNTLCAAGTGAFLSAQAKRLGLAVEEMGAVACSAENPARLSARCTVFAESDLIHKAQIGHSKADLVAGLCASVAANFLMNVGKGKTIAAPILFQGGVSRNIGVVAAFERELNCEIYVDPKGHLMGAVGAARLAAKTPAKQKFSFDITRRHYETKAAPCEKCPNLCEIIEFYRDGKLLDHWGNRCERVSEQGKLESQPA